MSNGDDDPIQNCVLEVCCDDEGTKQERALTHWVQHHVAGLSHEQAAAVAAALVEQYDLAPKGTLYAFKQAIARLAKGTPYTE